MDIRITHSRIAVTFACVSALVTALPTHGLAAQADEPRRDLAAASVAPTVVESPECAAPNSPARALLDRAARLDRDASLARLRATRDSLRAIAHPDDVEDQFMLAAVLGAEATLEGGMSQVRAAEAAFRHARRALALDPDHAGAAHILGRLHAGVMRTGRLTRFLATRLLGAEALADASWDEAERLLALAAEARPCDSEYRFELARVFADRGRIDRAVEELERTVTLPDRGTRARAARARARELKARLVANGVVR